MAVVFSDGEGLGNFGGVGIGETDDDACVILLFDLLLFSCTSASYHQE